MKATSVKQAWEMAGNLLVTDYNKDEARSANAGYPIYVSTLGVSCGYICDLGNRLEVNLPTGSSVNIWIEEEKPVRSVYYVTYEYNELGIKSTFWTEHLNVLIDMLNVIKGNPDCKLVSITTEEC